MRVRERVLRTNTGLRMYRFRQQDVSSSQTTPGDAYTRPLTVILTGSSRVINAPALDRHLGERPTEP